MATNGRLKVLSAAIFVFWAVMMGTMLHRQWSPEPLVFEGARLEGPRESWLALYLPGNQRMGYLQFEEKPEAREGVEGIHMSMRLHARLNLLGRPTTFSLYGTGWRALDSPTSTFQCRMLSEGHTILFSGELNDGLLDGYVETAGESFPISFPVGNQFMWPSALPLAMDFDSMEPGKAYMIESFDPVKMAPGQIEITYLREETLDVGEETYRAAVLDVTSSGFEATVWAAPNGELLRAETALGFAFQRTTQQDALMGLADQAPSDVLDIASIPLEGERPRHGAKSMRIRISGLPGDVRIPEDDFQSAEEPGVYRIVSQAPASNSDGSEASGFEEYLASDAMIQATHRRITERAQDLTRDIQDPWEKARRIQDWVYHNVAKTPVVSFPSALEVLDNLEGDCNEHTVLFTALARAAGVPTRIAIGVVWSDEHDGFYYHAWPEVFAGKWIWMDPTLGQPVADATHVKLLTGGIERWPYLMSFLGKLQIEVLDVEHES